MTAPRIFLVGPRASGKSTVGRLAAELNGWAFADADDEIERRAERPVADIFRTLGEPAFRDLETVVLADLADRKNIVIATGGGAVLRPRNREVLRTGFVARLAAPAGVLWARMCADPHTAVRRPNLTAAGGVEEVESVLAARESLYAAVADVTIDSTLSPAVAANVILSAWLDFAGRPSPPEA